MSWWQSHALIIFGFVLALVAAVNMLSQRRTPQSAWAWLIAMFAFPWVGVPLYLAFGGRKVRQLIESKQAIQLGGQHAPTARDTHVESVLYSLGIPPAQSENRVKLHHDAQEAYASLLETIDSARHAIWYSTFIFSKDPVGKEVRDRLAKKAAEGIEVKVLIDGVGGLPTRRHFFGALIDAGGEVTWFMPLFHRPLRGRTNLRNHRKMVIADGARVWSGGRNTAQEYMSSSPVTNQWRDLSYSLSGPTCDGFSRVFQSDWYFATQEQLECRRPIEPPSEHANDTVQVVPSGPDVPNDALLSALLTGTFAAKNRIWIVTPYFVPTESLSDALRLAARRRVDVRIIVPQASNHALADWARGPHLRSIQDAGATVLAHPSMVHAKAVIFDESTALVGSANFDERSLLLNYEVVLAAYSTPIIHSTECWFEELAKECEDWQSRTGRTRQLVESLAETVSPLL